MKRLLTGLMIVPALCLGLSSVAAAHNGDRHDQRRHHHHHRGRGHDKGRTIHLLPPSPPTSGVPPTPGNNPPPTPMPPETAGTIKSFSEGLLTLTLSDGTTTVTGRVDAHTRIECVSSGMAMNAHTSDNGGGQSGGKGGGQQSGDGKGGPGPSGGSGKDGKSGDGNGPGSQPEMPQSGAPQPPVGTMPTPGMGENEDQGDDEDNEGEVGPMCNSASLVPGVMVKDAVLRITSTGEVFEEIRIIQ